MSADAPTTSRFDVLAAAAIGLAGCALVGLVGVQGWQVFARYVLNDSPGWTEPLAVLMLVTAMSFGAAAGVHRQSHFAFTLLAQSAGPRLRRLMAAIAHLVVIGIGGCLAFWSARLLVDGFGIPMAGAPLPQSANYAPLCVGGALMVLFALRHLLRGLRGEED